ncbi:hypothetical protein MPSEU_000105300 [Mayamaea pseudoterrestris]|nr:hypothetical protein MPSEU_000105300 [Mayamaea pseudoterrestris]
MALSSSAEGSLPMVPLLVPNDYSSRRKNATSAEERCHLVHLAAEGIIHVIVDETKEILDVIDLEDMIGAKLVIEPKMEVAKESSSTSAAIKDRASNEPSSDILTDNKGCAILTLFSYPRQNLSQKSWFQRLGMMSPASPPPNPSNYQRPDKGDKNYGPRLAHHRSFVLAPSEDVAEASALVAKLQQLARPPKATTSKNSKVLILANPKSGPKRNGQVVAETQVQPMLEQAGLECIVVVLEHADHAIQLASDKATITYGGAERRLSDYSALVIVGGDGTVHQVLQGLYEMSDDKKDSATTPQLTIGVVGCGTANGFVTSLLHEAKERYGIIESILPICKGETSKVDLSRYTTSNQSYTSFLTFTWAMVADIDIDSELIHFLGEVRFDIWGVLRILWLRRYKARFSFLKPKKEVSTESIVMPALSDPVPSDWETIEDDFILFWASHVSHASMSNHQSPNSRLDDGVFQIFFIRSGVSKFRLIQTMLGLQAGTHVNVPGVEFIECVAYRLEPISPGSYNDIDGEVVEAGPIQAKVNASALNVFSYSKE